MSERAIKKGFRECGIYPFSKNTIKQLVKENTGVSSEKGIEYKVKNAVSAVIGERKRMDGDRQKNISKGEAKVEKNYVYGAVELRDLDRKRRRGEEEKEVENALKMDKLEAKKVKKAVEVENRKKGQEAKTCRGENCKSIWKSSEKWLICPCGSYFVCPKYSKA